MAVNKNPGSRDDNRGKFRGPEKTRYRGSNVPLADEDFAHSQDTELESGRPGMPDRASGAAPLPTPEAYKNMPDRITGDYADKGRKKGR